MKQRGHILMMMATVSTVAFIVSCSSKLKTAETLDLTKTPVQVVDSMFAVESENGRVTRRMESDRMERFDNDTSSIENFLGRFAIYSYNDEGMLETVILADKASHFTGKKQKKEHWLVTGNVSIQNVIKQETCETDSLYWDRTLGMIHTDCYVKMYSKDGFMQGYGMSTDEKASNSTILRPFNSYSVIVRDTTLVVVDSVNFIGPFIKK